jgi:hypothetical protein
VNAFQINFHGNHCLGQLLDSMDCFLRKVKPPIDSQQTLAFSALTGVRSMNEILPLERAAEGYQRMISGQARFRVVMTTGN